VKRERWGAAKQERAASVASYPTLSSSPPPSQPQLAPHLLDPSLQDSGGQGAGQSGLGSYVANKRQSELPATTYPCRCDSNVTRAPSALTIPIRSIKITILNFVWLDRAWTNNQKIKLSVWSARTVDPILLYVILYKENAPTFFSCRTIVFCKICLTRLGAFWLSLCCEMGRMLKTEALTLNI
jgi:hypothetical protein